MQGDGSKENITPGGNVFFTGGAGSTESTGKANYTLTSGLNTTATKGIKEEQQIVANETATLSKTKENIATQEASILESIAKNTRSENGWNINTSTEEGKELVKSLNNIDRMTKENGYSWSQNAETYAKANVGTSGLIKKIIGVDANIGGALTNTNASNQSVNHANDIITENNTSDKQSTHNSKGGHESWLSSIGIDQNKQNSLRESYNEVDRLDSSISQHKDNINSFHQTLDYIQNSGQEYRKDCYQDVLNGYQEKYGGSAADAQKAVSEGTPKAMDIFNQLSSKEFAAIRNKITQDGNNIKTNDAAGNFYKAQNFKENTGNLVDKEGKKQGFDGKEADEINNKGKILANQVALNNVDGENNFYNTQQELGDEKDKGMTTINKYEEDRIGNGLVAKIIGGASHVVSGGNAGWGIGQHTVNQNAKLTYTPVPNDDKPPTTPAWNRKGQPVFPNTPIELPNIDLKNAQNISNNNKELIIPSHLKPKD